MSDKFGIKISNVQFFNRTQCQAYAESSKSQCKKSTLRGSRYCWSHHTKGPIIVSLLGGGLISLFLGLGWDYFQVSNEEQELIRLRAGALDLNDNRIV